MSPGAWCAGSLLAAAAAVLACTPRGTGAGLTPEVAIGWGCNGDSVVAQAQVLDSTRRAGYEYVPRVGWDVCELLVHNGTPSKIERQETQTGHYMSWWYQTEAATHLVNLEWIPERRCWLVTYVGW